MPISKSWRLVPDRRPDLDERAHRPRDERGRHGQEEGQRRVDVVVDARQVVPHFVGAEDGEQRQAVPEAAGQEAPERRAGTDSAQHELIAGPVVDADQRCRQQRGEKQRHVHQEPVLRVDGAKKRAWQRLAGFHVERDPRYTDSVEPEWRRGGKRSVPGARRLRVGAGEGRCFRDLWSRGHGSAQLMFCKSLPGLNRMVRPGGMRTSLPVLGLRPMPRFRGLT